jgi:hypothetical protein
MEAKDQDCSDRINKKTLQKKDLPEPWFRTWRMKIALRSILDQWSLGKNSLFAPGDIFNQS